MAPRHARVEPLRIFLWLFVDVDHAPLQLRLGVELMQQHMQLEPGALVDALELLCILIVAQARVLVDSIKKLLAGHEQIPFPGRLDVLFERLLKSHRRHHGFHLRLRRKHEAVIRCRRPRRSTLISKLFLHVFKHRHELHVLCIELFNGVLKTVLDVVDALVCLLSSLLGLRVCDRAGVGTVLGTLPFGVGNVFLAFFLALLLELVDFLERLLPCLVGVIFHSDSVLLQLVAHSNNLTVGVLLGCLLDERELDLNTVNARNHSCSPGRRPLDDRRGRLGLQVRRRGVGVGSILKELGGVGRVGAQELGRVGVAPRREALEPLPIAEKVVQRRRRGEDEGLEPSTGLSHKISSQQTTF